MDPSGVIVGQFTFTNNHEALESLTSRLNMHDAVVMESKSVLTQGLRRNAVCWSQAGAWM